MHSLSKIPACIRKSAYSVSELRRCITTITDHNDVKPFNAIPAPPSLPVIGHLHLFSRFGPYSFEKILDAYEDLHQKYGDVVRLNLGVQMVLLADPRDIELLYPANWMYPKRPVFEALVHYRRSRENLYSCAGLVTENGGEWRRLRGAINFMMIPHFASPYLPAQEKIAEDFVNLMRKKRNLHGQIPNYLQEIYHYTEEAIGQVCFGMRLGLLDMSTSQSKFCSKLTQAADDTMQALAVTLLGFPWWKFFNTPTYKKLVEAQDFFQSFASDCVKKAKKKLEDPDFDGKEELEFLRRLIHNEELSPLDVSLILTEIFSAGIDATGNTIGFILYHLSQRPDIQEKLYEEIVLHKEDGQPLSPEKLQKMKFLKACIKESYRLNPASGGNARILSEPVVFSGYYVPAGVLCVGQNPIICRQNRNFEKPLEYLPERWVRNDTHLLKRVGHPFSILPFSHGVRKCVGQRFAEQEIKLAIIKIIENFKIEYDGPPIGCKMRMTLVPDKPLDFTFIER